MSYSVASERSYQGPAYKGLGMEGWVAKWYAGLTGKRMEDFRNLAHRVAGLIPPGSSVLEVAPGPGYFAIELAKAGPYRVTGLDIGKTFVEIAQANAANAGVSVEFRQGNASHMPFQSETFEFILCRAAFKNFAEPLKALEEMCRVLKDGGTALIIDLRRDASRESIGKAVDRMQLGPVNTMLTKLTFRYMLLKRAYTKSEFERFASQTKFESVKIEGNAIGLEVWLHKGSRRNGLS